MQRRWKSLSARQGSRAKGRRAACDQPTAKHRSRPHSRFTSCPAVSSQCNHYHSTAASTSNKHKCSSGADREPGPCRVTGCLKPCCAAGIPEKIHSNPPAALVGQGLLSWTPECSGNINRRESERGCTRPHSTSSPLVDNCRSIKPRQCSPNVSTAQKWKDTS